MATNTDPRPTGLDLFAGAGGLSLGFEQAGFDVLTAVEYDPVHAAVHEFNFPLTEVVCANLAKVSVEQVNNALDRGWSRHGRAGDRNGELDVVFGGPPCQGFSSIGKRLIDDSRNELVFHFFRMVDELKPKYFVMENVPGMLRGGHKGILRQLIREFREIGYRVPDIPNVLNAAEFGVPQDRRRLFLIGSRGDQPMAEYPKLVSKPPHRHGLEIEEARPLFDGLPDGPTVWDAIGDLPDLDEFDELKRSDWIRLSEERLDAMESLISDYVRGLRDGDAEDRSYPRAWDRQLFTSSARTIHTSKSISRFESTMPGDTEPISRFYRLHPAGLSNTLRAGTGSERGAFTSPRPIHPTLPRVISVREAARLHSFPDWFRFHVTKWHGFRQIGNAVAPLVGRAVGAEIAAALEVSVNKPDKQLDFGDEILISLRMAEAAEHFGADKDAIPAQRQRTPVARRRVAA